MYYQQVNRFICIVAGIRQHIKEVNQGGQWSWAVNEVGPSMKPVRDQLWQTSSIDYTSSWTVLLGWQSIYNKAGHSKFFIARLHCIDCPPSLTAHLHGPPWLTSLISKFFIAPLHWLPSFIDRPSSLPTLINLSIIKA